MPDITAHAGALQTRPNTLESVKICLAAPGVRHVEVDVRFLPDGTPVLGHEKAGTVPLADCLALVAPTGKGLNLDMKETANVPAVVALLRAYGMEKTGFFTGIAPSAAAAVRDCGVRYYLNCSPKKSGADALALVELAKELGAVGLNVCYRRCPAKLVAAAHKAGLPVSVWTVDKPRAMRRMLALSVDNITTRRPDVWEELLHAA
ncbi:MAG: glycerophosphodiester phosphodiesterase [Oscillospiraceae bacterium]|jgi:glycerophosphoryl diester phosphodiesterase|nr:glycerophosphodiester phosphodiesterase [Oscillospiraceae bacterium]